MFGFGKEKTLPAALAPKPQKEENTSNKMDDAEFFKFIDDLKDAIIAERNSGCCNCDVSCCKDADAVTRYCVIGEFPNIQIVEKFYVEEDEYCYCLRNKDSNSIGLYQKETVFCSYEGAMHKVIELIQKQAAELMTKPAGAKRRGK